jgi:hypothetical protein
MERMDKYQYSPLNDAMSNIRLLSVKCASQTGIELSLRHVPNLTAKAYNCLSYTWGPKEPTFPVVCDGRTLGIRKNLYEGLIHLFATHPDMLSAIWIDAVCMDQENEAEKDCQLPRMHDIYAGAESVVIWLGTENDGLVFERFDFVVQKVRDQKFVRDDEDGVTFFNRLLEINDGAGSGSLDLRFIHLIDVDSWLAVRSLAFREYWRRQWVWQEIISSKADPIVVCGYHTLIWEDLRRATHAFTTFGDDAIRRQGRIVPLPDYFTQDMMMFVNHAHRIAFWRDLFLRNGTPDFRLRFGTLVLQEARNSYTCWDERDRLFAHVGVCKYEKLDGWAYSRPFAKLYTHFWCDILRRAWNVNLLTFIEDESARWERPRMSKDSEGGMLDAGLPSWVPDLRASLNPPSMWQFFANNENFNISKGVSFTRGRNEGQSTSEIFVDEGRGRLTLRGYRFDEVSERARGTCQIIELLKNVLRNGSAPYGTLAEAVDGIWASMAVLTSHDVKPAFPIPEDLRMRAHHWLLHNPSFTGQRGVLDCLGDKSFEFVQDVFECDPTGLVIPRQETHALSRAGDGAPEKDPLLERDRYSLDFVKFGLQYMTLFRTCDGWIGKGSKSLEVGDEIWIFPGAVVGFLLRPLGKGTHRFVGHAYVHGIMEGEAAAILEGREPMEVVLV